MIGYEFALTVALTNHVRSIALKGSYCTMAICDISPKTRFLGQNSGFRVWCKRIQ